MKSKELKILFSEEEIQSKIKEIADKMNKLYNGEELIAICVLKGAVMFAIDLVKHLEMPLQMEVIRLSSYVMERQRLEKFMLWIFHYQTLMIKTY